MKRLGTTPRRRPTVACSPTIGHRTPKAPKPTHKKVAIKVPFCEDTIHGVTTLWVNSLWKEVPSLGVIQEGVEATWTFYKPSWAIANSLPTNWLDVKIIRDEDAQQFIITAKMPTPHAPPPR